MHIFPSKADFQRQINEGFNVISVWTELLADLETPVSCFMKVKEAHPEQPLFMLESVEGGEKLGRYSFVGLNPAALLTVKGGSTSFQAFEEGLQIKLTTQGQPFEALNELLNTLKSPSNDLPYATAGLVGALAYDAVRFVEPIPKLKVDPDYPEAAFVMIGDLIVFDNLTRTIKLISNVYFPSPEKAQSQLKKAAQRLNALKALLEGEIKTEHRRNIETTTLKELERTGDWDCSLNKTNFEGIVEQAQERIRAGDIFQIVLSRQMKLRNLPHGEQMKLRNLPHGEQMKLRNLPHGEQMKLCNLPHGEQMKLRNLHQAEQNNLQGFKLDPLYVYRLLRSLNPSPYLFLLDFVGFQLVGSSPEVMVKSEVDPVSGERSALLRPIAGTYRRGKTADEDSLLASKLKEDPKELAEHLMLIDLARNDLGRVAVPGSVQMTDLMIVEKYSHVLHLVSEVVCKMKNDCTLVDLLKAVFPAGTLSGAPKVKAMQIISELEPEARGFYGGCVGYIGYNGYMNTAMTIRTLLIGQNEVRLQAGAGIVYDSDPGKEYQETLNKAAALMKVVEQALHNGRRCIIR